MAQVARKHHFVPQCYLGGFTDSGAKDGRLCVFDFVANRFFREKPKNVAFEVDFNCVDVEGHSPDALESAFGEFEGFTASVIRRICSEGQLPKDEEFSYVLNLISLLAVRNPANRRSMTAARLQMCRDIDDLLASDRRLYEYHLRKARTAGFVSGREVPFEEMQAFVRRGAYTVEISPQGHLQTELRVCKKILASVSSRYWSLLIAASGAPDFITCDHPVRRLHRQVVFPLDAKHAVMGNRERPAPARIVLEAVDIAEVNLRILNLADRQVYSRTPDVAVLSNGRLMNVRLPEIGCLRSKPE
jgi:hypothetical protein